MNQKLKIWVEIVSIVVGSISIISLIFGWGAIFNTYKTDVANAKDSAILANAKADLADGKASQALTEISDMKLEVDSVYKGLLRIGVANQVQATSTK